MTHILPLTMPYRGTLIQHDDILITVQVKQPRGQLLPPSERELRAWAYTIQDWERDNHHHESYEPQAAYDAAMELVALLR